MAKEIPLTCGKVTIVDDEMYEILSVHKWCVSSKEGNCSAVRSVIDASGHGRAGTEYVHQVVMNHFHGEKPGRRIGHADGDNLNNQVENLYEIRKGTKRRGTVHSSR